MSQLEEDRWEALYSHLLFVEQHWTDQLQNQQQRNSAILTVNGFILGFLGFGTLTGELRTWDVRYANLFMLGVGVLALALLFGILSMIPAIHVTEHPWLKAKDILEHADRPPEEVFETLARWLGVSQDEGHHARTLKRRRRLMYAEIVLLIVGLALVAAAFVFSVLDW